jgi:hypothetical protein
MTDQATPEPREGRVYLRETSFHPQQPLHWGGHYSVQVDEKGVLVNSECCADRMDRETAAKLYAALGRWLGDHSQVPTTRFEAAETHAAQAFDGGVDGG